MDEEVIDSLMRHNSPYELICRGGEIHHSNVLKAVSVLVYSGGAFPVRGAEWIHLTSREKAVLVGELVHKLGLGWAEAGHLFGWTRQRTYYWKQRVFFTG